MLLNLLRKTNRPGDTATAANAATRRDWRPVKQAGAETFLLISLVFFALTVIVTRLYLQLTGYPQIGDKVFHISHLLWGGLFLLISVFLTLLVANRWVQYVAAVLSGIGVGLFIDEVGKFITQSNDYFFPLAFPIIYAFLLIGVWLYLEIRRPAVRNARTLLYHALEKLERVLDNDFPDRERAELTAWLQTAALLAVNANQRDLAQELLDFINTPNLELVRAPGLLERLQVRGEALLTHNVTRRALRLILVVGWALIGLRAFGQLLTLALLATGGLAQIRSMFGDIIIMNGKSAYLVHNTSLLFFQYLVGIVAGSFSFLGALWLIIGREQRGVRMGMLGLVLSLSVLNLLSFYFNQIDAIGGAVLEFLLFLVALLYRRWYVTHDGSS